MSRYLTLWLTVLLVAGGSSAALAQGAKPTAKATKKVVMKEQTPGLLKKAKVPADSARKLATAKLSGEKVSKEEIRQSGGKLVYSFYFKNSAKGGVDVVDVDANTASVADARHETSTEAKAERKTGAVKAKAAPSKLKTS